MSRCSGSRSIAAAQAFHARTIKRRAVLFDARAGGLGAIAPILIKDLVVDRRRTDAAGRAVAYEAIEPLRVGLSNLSRNRAHSGDSRAPCCGTSCSLPNQRSAARTLDLWFARVFAVTPTRA